MDKLSISRFKGMDVENLSPEDNIDYHLARLMNLLIEELELALPNERQFARMRYKVMALLHEIREDMQGAGT